MKRDHSRSLLHILINTVSRSAVGCECTSRFTAVIKTHNDFAAQYSKRHSFRIKLNYEFRAGGGVLGRV